MGVSIALACLGLGVSETCFRYCPKRDDEIEQIADLLVGLIIATRLAVSGCASCICEMSKGMSGTKADHRIYCELELNLRINPPRRLKRDELAVPEASNLVWSME